MKAILSTLLALAVLGGVAAPASATFHGSKNAKTLFDAVDRKGI